MSVDKLAAQQQLTLVEGKALPEQSKPEPQFYIAPKIRSLVEAGLEIEQGEPTPQEIAFYTRYLVQASLPYRAPKNKDIWARPGGNFDLVVQPGTRKNRKTGEYETLGFPYGQIPRLLLFWISTEIVRTKDRKLYLGNSLTQFMLKIGLNPYNGSVGSKRSDKSRLNKHMESLFRARISFDFHQDRNTKYLDMQIAPYGNLWWDPKHPDQLSLWETEIVIGEAFFMATMEASIPVDTRALRVLKSSALELDLYVWAQYKQWCANRYNKPQRIPWKSLGQQLGAEYKDPRNLDKKLRKHMKAVQVVSRGLKLDSEPGVLIFLPGGLTAIEGRKS